jgi:hypothetical protein
MGIMNKSGGIVFWVVALLVASLVIGGCGGIKPYEPRNNREEGPEKGLFTGSEGEFVILRKAEEPKKEGEDKNSPNKSESSAQPEPDSDQGEKVDGPPGGTP